jgi:uncharacterized protein (TIGR00369 family)
MTRIGEVLKVGLGDNQCFGCSQEREDGLRLAFTRTGERTVECMHTVSDVYRGMKGVVHGGMQALLLDEAVGMAGYLFWPPGFAAVTAELNLTYRRPVPLGEELILRAELSEEDERDLHVSGAILDSVGTELTTAVARLRKVKER